MQIPLLQKAEELSIDYRFQQWSQPALADTNVVIIAIDNQSLDYFAESGLPWPWSRDTYAFMLDVLHNAGVRAVLLDLLFYDADVDRFEIDTRFSDEAFARRHRKFTRDLAARGDDVNLAPRLEGANKPYGTHIMIGENTRALIGDRFICRELDAITVKGKLKPLRIFELVDFDHRAERSAGRLHLDFALRSGARPVQVRQVCRGLRPISRTTSTNRRQGITNDVRALYVTHATSAGTLGRRI